MDSKNKKINLVCKARLDKYSELTSKALKIAKQNIAKTKQAEAKEISNLDLNTMIMSNYLVCENAIDLLEKSTISMNNNMQKELSEYKKKLELVSERVMDSYLKKAN